MATVSDTLIGIRPYAGYTDRSLPQGVWAVLAFVTGDATGGNRTVMIDFSVQGTIGGGNIFSLEQLCISDTNNANKDLDVLCNNFDGIGTGAPFQNGFRYGLAIGTVARAIRETNLFIPVPFFMGIPRKGFTGSLQVSGNNVDAAVLRVEAQGYWWSPRSINDNGGVRRPVNGLYPS